MNRDKTGLDGRQAALQPEDGTANIQAWFELGGDFDSAGFQAEAMRAYDRVFASGPEHLRPEQQPQLYLQAGSTLRNLERPDDARCSRTADAAFRSFTRWRPSRRCSRSVLIGIVKRTCCCSVASWPPMTTAGHSLDIDDH